MATQTYTVQTDDLDPKVKSNIETVYFYNYADSEYYEIDLGKANRDKYDEALAPFLKVARKSSRVKVHANPAGKGQTTAAVIREWAKAHNIEVNERGRVDADVVAKYNAAHTA